MATAKGRSDTESDKAKTELLESIVKHLERGDAPAGKFPDAKGEYWALCPYHKDDHADNFSVSVRGFNCFACGHKGGLRKLAEKLGVAPVQLCSDSPDDGNAHPPSMLEAYAEAKRLPLAFLASLGLQMSLVQGQTCIRIPYCDADGAEVAVRLRTALAGKDRFRWRSGSHPQPYGLWRLDPGAQSFVLLVEGESDAQTLWQHGIPALGIPGATTWRPEWRLHVEGLAVYAWQEPDAGGEAFIAAIGATLPDCRIISAPPGRKDISECHVLGDDVPALVERLKAAARPYRELQAERNAAAACQAKELAAPLVGLPDILAAFAELCAAQGLVGEEKTAKLLYLAVTSRLLRRPVSVAVKGPSSSGKSYTVETVLNAVPASAYYALTSMSERALAYSDEPLVHRMLVLYEAAGQVTEFGQYLVRTLLSEGCIRYETVEKTAAGLKPRLIERPGPTGLLITTTWASLHPENETRMFSVTARDDPAQTAGVLQVLGERATGADPKCVDFAPWHALQTWLELAGCREVAVPYARRLADLADARAVRLRRDFGAVLNLVRAHAILHQARRARDPRGRIVATLADYAAVYDLVIDPVSEGVRAAASKTVRETVAAVVALDRETSLPVSMAALARRLGLDISAVNRRTRVAIDQGYLTNLEDKRGKPARLVLGDPLPEETTVLPAPDVLQNECACVTVSRNTTAQLHSPGAAAAGAPRRVTVDQLLAEEVDAWPAPLLEEVEE